MTGSLEIALAYLLDTIIGDPRCLPHPVQIMGRAVTGLERILLTRVHRPLSRAVAGSLTVCIVVGLSYLITAGITSVAWRLGPVPGVVASSLLVFFSISRKTLGDHANAVYSCLTSGDLHAARQAVAMIVGRDTAFLDEEGISRATVETVAESLSDGVIAPLFYAVLGGAPLAMAYKAINTLDSMIGHKNERYRHFGLVAARLDDLANLAPARISALLLTLASRAWEDRRRAFLTALRDGSRHPSPNSGYPEAAMAGLLDVRLGGLNTYSGVLSERPQLRHEGRSPTARDIPRAVTAMNWASLAGAGAYVLARLALWGVTP